jgi:tripeptidyl-peptidase-1
MMHWLSLLPFFVASPICLAKPIAPRWDDMTVKHSWDSTPDKWEYHGPPPDGAVIDLHIALKPHSENALVDALFEVSNPEHPKFVPVSLYLGVRLCLLADVSAVNA